MARELVAALLALPAAGCSWLLDFSDHAIPHDASIDAPYTQAECDYKEPNDSLATAVAITPADTGPAAICAGRVEDHDFYRFTVPAGTAKVEVQIAAAFSTTGDLDLRLWARTGSVKLAESRGFGDTETIACPSSASMCPALPAGDYAFEVFPATASAINRYTFSLVLTPM